MANLYTKAPFTTKEIISKLQKKGLLISNLQGAEQFLLHVSYYRFSSYLINFQDLKNNKTFLHNTDFNDVMQLYDFDCKLRFLLLGAIEKIEISVRTCLINTYSLSHGTNWYENLNLFENPSKHQELLVRIDELLKKNANEKFIKHYNTNYDSSKRPPSWMVFETFTLGTLSNLFSLIKTDNTKKQVAWIFKIKAPFILESWLHTLTYIRNIVAHHNRLWNRELAIKPAILKKPIGTWIDCNSIQKNRLYLAISSIQYLLNAISLDNTFSYQLKELFKEYPKVDLSKMGFPSNWEKQPLWK